MKTFGENLKSLRKINNISQKDFADIQKMKKIAKLLEDNNIWKSFDNEYEGINVSIGKENKVTDLEDVSIVSTKLKLSSQNSGTIAIIGPTRMDYSQVIDALEYLSNSIDELVNDKEK